MSPILLNTGQSFPVFWGILPSLTNHWRLVWALSKRELADRYSGHVFGLLWVFGHPLVLIGLYVFVFAFVLKLRIRDGTDLPGDYTIYLLSGLIAWMTFQDAAAKSCTAVTARANLVKQVVFPLEVLPVHSVIVSFLTQLVSSVLLTIYLVSMYGRLPGTYLFLPVLFLLQLLLMIGVSFTLSSCAVFFRDLKDVVGVATLVCLYAMPVMYSPEWVPESFQPILYFNPFSHMIWCYQDAVFFGRFVHGWSWLLFPAFSLGVFCGGLSLFRRLKPYFSGTL